MNRGWGYVSEAELGASERRCEHCGKEWEGDELV